ncbi:MAG: 4-hydroxybenzaldehyde dehydrogenase [Candidatus Petromonas sp.]|nr:4-hydroxybenzaldehyde dehydrogenase [Candidatus Petromonas sp.]
MSKAAVKYPSWNKQFIGGEWKEGSSNKFITVKNPYNGEVLAEIKLANKQDIDDAYKIAKEAQKSWADVPAYEKISFMERVAELFAERKEELVNLLIEESGSSRIKAGVEVDCCIADIKEAAKYPLLMNATMFPSNVPGKENRVYRIPVGVIGMISPWNWPLYLSIRGVAPAIAAGNSIVLKTASLTPITGGLIIAKIFEEAGLPKGIFSVVAADPGEIGDYMVEHPIPSVISFTGSTNVGRRIGEIAGRNLKKAALELGGNNVFIVLDDADIDQAVPAAVFGKYFHQGQICIATNRIIVDRKIYPEFVDKFKKLTEKIKVGNPADPDTIIGPMITQKQVDKLTKILDDCASEGAKVILRGKVEGNLMWPSIVIDVTNDMTIAQTELFGPVATIIPVDSEEEAIKIANDSDFGLSGAVFSGSLERGIRVAKQIETGMIHVNDQTVNVDPGAPFGGEKASGLGRYCGVEWAIDDFTTVKWVSVQNEYRQWPF